MMVNGYFFYFSLKPYVVNPHLNHFIEMVEMRGHNLCLYAELTKLSLIITKYMYSWSHVQFNHASKVFTTCCQRMLDSSLCGYTVFIYGCL